MASPESIATEAEDFIVTKMLKEHPFMEVSFVRGLARTLQTEIERRLPQSVESKNRFDFFGLPPEIRCQIYDLVVVRRVENGQGEEDAVIDIDIADHNEDEDEYEDEYDYEPERAHVRALQLAAKQPSLTKVCRRMREETLPIFYGSNRFKSHSSSNILTYHRHLTRFPHGSAYYTDAGADNWFQRIGNKNAALIKDFTLVYPPLHGLTGITQSVVQNHFLTLGIELPQVTQHLTYNGWHKYLKANPRGSLASYDQIISPRQHS